MPRILTAEDVVRRIAGECAFVDERGGGIRLEPGRPAPTIAGKSRRGRPVAFKAEGADRQIVTKPGDVDCERRLKIPHNAVMPPSTNSRAPVT